VESVGRDATGRNDFPFGVGTLHRDKRERVWETTKGEKWSAKETDLPLRLDSRPSEKVY
jgi:hypothetical protein